MKDSTQTRRAFCTRGCQALSTAALGGVLGSLFQGCGSFVRRTPATALPALQATETSGAVILTVDAVSPLAVIGGAGIVRASSGPILVVRTAATTFSALDGTCTHRVCAITGLGLSKQTFVCPCHGSQFDLGGHVMNGLARVDLRPHTTAFTDPLLTIRLSTT